MSSAAHFAMNWRGGWNVVDPENCIAWLEQPTAMVVPNVHGFECGDRVVRFDAAYPEART
jgi:hypothetical protein